MPRRFLPVAASAANAQTDRFSDEAIGFIGELGATMPVAPARSEGRVPSPVSRAYVFYSNLHARGLSAGDQAGGDGASGRAEASAARRALQDEARQTFRGLLALFALRRVLNVPIALERRPITPRRDEVSDVLLTALRAAPGGEEFWNPVRFFTTGHGNDRTILAGLSPLTGFFPAARAPESLPAVYWYEYDAQHRIGRWTDPTDDRPSPDVAVRIPEATRRLVRELLAAWLKHTLDTFRVGFLDSLRLDRGDQELFLNELRAWQRDLGTQVLVPEGVSVDTFPIPGLRESVADGVPFFETVVNAPAAHVVSDFPLANGRLLVSLNRLALGQTRIYGRRFGGHEAGQAGQALPDQGSDLGVALGWGPRTAPVPFLVVDRLFTPRLTLITSRGLSPEWRGMPVDMGGGLTETALLPFRPAVLEYFSPEDIARASGALSHDNRTFTVTLPLPGGETVTRIYQNGPGEYRLDDAVVSDTFDVRLFPNFDLDAVRGYLPSFNDRQPDAVYHARVRLHPTWPFETYPIGRHGERLGEATVVGTDEILEGGANRSGGRAAFFEMTQKPFGFALQDRGFVTVHLLNRTVENVNPADWAVGVDFGTSNTCVSYQVLDGTDASRPAVLEFEAMTTALLAAPSYGDDLDGRVAEGAAAMLDFFPSPDGRVLNPHGYFPSQVVTQQTSVGDSRGFRLSNGLLYARNLSLANPQQMDLLRDMVELESYGQQRRLERRFHLRRNIKWKEKDWLLVFLQHLRKMITLTAALHRARVVEVRFSYPKSFSSSTRRLFKDDFESAWSDSSSGVAVGSLGAAEGGRRVRIESMSESEATKGRLITANSPFVVIDVGGGTTDITGFKSGDALFQTSFLLSAGHLNRYVSASRPLREALLPLFERVTGATKRGSDDYTMMRKHFVDGGRESGAQASRVEIMWFALLQTLEGQPGVLDNVMLSLREMAQDPEQKRAVEGFFLTATLLFGGLAYLSGYLMRSAADRRLDGGAEALRDEALRIELTGNGSKLYRLLSVEGETPFQRVFEDLFRAGFRQDAEGLRLPQVAFDGIYRDDDGREMPKATVALGLLQTEIGKRSVIPLYDAVGEEGVAPALAHDYYADVQARRASFRAPDEPPVLLHRFLDTLDDRLPYGKNGGFPVVPLTTMSETWAEDLLGTLYERTRVHMQERILATAATIEGLKGLSEDEQPALEPLFVAELAGLLDTVREKYADTNVRS